MAITQQELLIMNFVYKFSNIFENPNKFNPHHTKKNFKIKIAINIKTVYTF